jgi:inhibitor of KinA
MTLPEWTTASDHSLLVRFGEEVSLDIHQRVLRLSRLLEGSPKLLNIHPGYSTLLISFDPRRNSYTAVEEVLRSALARMDAIGTPPPRLNEVPVRYGGEFGPDLEEVARLRIGLSHLNLFHYLAVLSPAIFENNPEEA